MSVALLAAFYKDAALRSFADGLSGLGFELLASAGTAKFLNEAGIPTRDVAELVGPPILGHRVVTLAREVYAALLSRPGHPEDEAELKRIGVKAIDLVYVDLYPLDQALKDPNRTHGSVLEKIDIGGPTLMRAAAKGGRIVVSIPMQFEEVLVQLRRQEGLSPLLKAEYAAEAELRLAAYSTAAARFYETVGRGVLVPTG